MERVEGGPEDAINLDGRYGGDAQFEGGSVTEVVASLCGFLFSD